MSEHTVSSYDEELRALAGRVAEMGGLAEALVNDAVTALLSQDLEKAHKTILQDARLDALQQETKPSSSASWPCASRWGRTCARSWPLAASPTTLTAGPKRGSASARAAP